jgi:hypothetical protein
VIRQLHWIGLQNMNTSKRELVIQKKILDFSLIVMHSFHMRLVLSFKVN